MTYQHTDYIPLYTLYIIIQLIYNYTNNIPSCNFYTIIQIPSHHATDIPSYEIIYTIIQIIISIMEIAYHHTNNIL